MTPPPAGTRPPAPGPGRRSRSTDQQEGGADELPAQPPVQARPEAHHLLDVVAEPVHTCAHTGRPVTAAVTEPSAAFPQGLGPGREQGGRRFSDMLALGKPGRGPLAGSGQGRGHAQGEGHLLRATPTHFSEGCGAWGGKETCLRLYCQVGLVPKPGIFLLSALLTMTADTAFP